MVCVVPTLVYEASPVVTLTLRDTFTLTYSTTTITLPAPDFNDRTDAKPDRIQRKTPGGELITYQAGTWSKVKTYRYSFSALTLTQRDDLMAFLLATLGLPVTVVDHQTLTYTGIVTNPNGDFSEVLQNCGYTCSLEIEVV
jgi:hypothetical protein